MYKVIKEFSDLKDRGYVYHAGDEYPRMGIEVSAERVAELASANNKRGMALIEAVDTPQGRTIQAVEEEKEQGDEVPAEIEKELKKPKKANKRSIKEEE